MAPPTPALRLRPPLFPYPGEPSDAGPGGRPNGGGPAAAVTLMSRRLARPRRRTEASTVTLAAA
ncbi:hypothetical protein ACWGDT_20080 [Streptomyces avermitilis]